MASTNHPSPEIIFGTFFAYQRTAALKTAIDLGIFTAIDEGEQRASGIARRAEASERGTRIVCDYLTLLGLLSKTNDEYALTPESAFYLSKKSPAYLGSMCDFLVSPAIKRNFDALTSTVKRGTIAAESNTVSGEEQEHWVTFARAMVPMMMPSAIAIADLLDVAAAGPMAILDVAAGHGMFGIVLAQRNPKAEVVALDWPAVVAVATENAAKLGVANRHRTLAGDAFRVEFGRDYDLVLLTNFLHHYDETTNVRLLEKVGRALKPGGRAVIVEFVPNEDRVSPPMAAGFSLTMLAGTPSGDTYTLSQLKQMLAAAGFRGAVASHPLPGPETVVVATR